MLSSIKNASFDMDITNEGGTSWIALSLIENKMFFHPQKKPCLSTHRQELHADAFLGLAEHESQVMHKP